jgi:hypothetical protein
MMARKANASANKTTSRVMALGLLLATLIAMLLPPASAGAGVVPAGTARSWDDNTYGQLGNGNTGTDSDVWVGVKDLPNVKNIDGGYEFTLATTQ